MLPSTRRDVVLIAPVRMHMQHNETELIRRCQEGDRNAFGILYDLHIRTVYNFIYYKTRHKETAEDLTSETFFKALRSMKSVDPSRPFISWLYKIAQNSVIDHYRSKRPMQNIDDVWDMADEDDAIEALDNALDVKKVKAEFSKLSAAERDIIFMRIWQELSYKEISEIIGKSEASIKMSFSRSMKKLRGFQNLQNL